MDKSVASSEQSYPDTASSYVDAAVERTLGDSHSKSQQNHLNWPIPCHQSDQTPKAKCTLQKLVRQPSSC